MTDYYAPTSYNPDSIPDQHNSKARSWLRKFSATRLPWGRAQNVVPERIMTDPTPNSMRFWEKVEREREEQRRLGTYKPKPFEDVELHAVLDHERFRHALLSNRSQFWMLLCGAGKFLSFFITPIVVLVMFMAALKSYAPFWDEFFSVGLGMFEILLLPIYMAWIVGFIVTEYFPKLWFKPSRGPLWELNRRNGMVTVFDYDNNGEYKRSGTIGELVAPFHEFDAYINTSPDRQGLPMNFLYLAHRYRDITINLADLVAPTRNPEMPMSLWDFFQNYMDVSQPLPDLPCFEKYRSFDPVTAEHDRQTGRNPRYWIDMDDQTFEGLCHDMLGRVDAIDTLQRPNLMANHCQYID